MENRLKAIWSEFESVTTRRLTGSGVDNIHVPHRVDYQAVDEAFLPESFDAPAEAAFSALREKLSEQEKLFSKKRRRPGKRDAAETDILEPSYDGHELIRGMKATALRTERPDRDYTSFMGTKDGEALLRKHQKKRRFKLF